MKLQALPFAEAIAALKTRRDNPLPSNRWQEVFGEEHAIAGTVARSAGFDILGDILGSLQETLEKGGTYESWRKDITPVLKAKGWWGKTTDAEGRTVQLGSPHRLATIFDVNMRVSYGAGRWEQIQRVKARRPWLRYVAVQDERTRKSHKGWHGTILAVDDPWWDTHYPPNGWRCRCTVVQLSDRDLARYGWTPSPAAPPSPTTTWRNPVTGDVLDVPAGIDPAWGHNVGKARETALQALAKLDRVPPTLAVAAPRAMPDLLSQTQDEFAAWVKGMDKTRPRGESRPVGLLSPTVLHALEERGVAPTSAVIHVRDHDIAHMLRKGKPDRKKLEEDDVARMGDVLRTPEAVLRDRLNGALVYVFSRPTSRPGKFIVLVGFQTRQRTAGGGRESVTFNLVRTAGTEDAGSLRDITRYELLEGDWP